MDLRLAMMCGNDIPIPDFQTVIHQPRINEIALIGENDFFVGAQCLTLNKSMFTSKDNTALTNKNNFQIFMMVMKDKEANDKKASVVQVLQLLFPNYKPVFSPASLILMGNGIPNITIDEQNFDLLQSYMKAIFCSKNGPMDQQSFNPADDKAKEIAEKLMHGRQRIANEKGSSGGSVLSQYLSILTVGLQSMSLKELQNLTMFQLYDLVERYSLYTEWDLDIRSRLAGGKPDHQPDNWMKNLH